MNVSAGSIWKSPLTVTLTNASVVSAGKVSMPEAAV